MPPVKSSCGAPATRIERQMAAAELAARSPERSQAAAAGAKRTGAANAGISAGDTVAGRRAGTDSDVRAFVGTTRVEIGGATSARPGGGAGTGRPDAERRGDSRSAGVGGMPANLAG